MSARMIGIRSNPQPAKGEMRELRLLTAGSPILALPGPNTAADDLSGFVDSDQFRDDLLRRLESAYALSWRHGGLNE